MNLIARLRPLISQPRQSVLQGYSNDAFWRRSIVLFGAVYAAILVAAGAAFALYGTNVLMPVSGLLAVFALLIVWVLPESSNPPLIWMRRLLFGFLIALMFWPDYLAFDFPGLPWITAMRMFAVPLAAAFLISLSVSPAFRKELAELLKPTSLTNVFLLLFVACAALSIVYSRSPGSSGEKFTIGVLYWFVVFYVSVWLFSKPGTLRTFAYLMWAFAILTSLIGLREWQLQAIPWAGHIPSFLAVDDPVIQTILSAKARSTTGIYRVQSKFNTPLSFAEFLAFSTPFILYFAVFGRNFVTKFAALASLPLIFLSILRTDSRLGATGFFMSFLLFMVAWGVVRWRQRRESVFGPAITISYPFVAIGFFIATFFVGRLRNMVWGTKAQSFSSQAREAQWDSGIPKLLAQPWGYGMGEGGGVLGYRNLAGVLTIDSHYLAALLEFGIAGFLIYACFFLSSLAYGSFAIFKADTTDHLLLIPCMILVSIFVVEKAVFAQIENHALAYAAVGGICAMCWRIAKDARNTTS